METIENKSQYQVNAVYGTDYSISMSGCPVDSSDDIRVEDSAIEQGHCLSVKTNVSLWSIIPGKEKSLYDLCLIIGSNAKSVLRRAVRQLKKLLLETKSTVLIQQPCFLRL